jgi:hypothetical protein
MNYRGPGFLAVVWFGFSLTLHTPLSCSKLSIFLSFPEMEITKKKIHRLGYRFSYIFKSIARPDVAQAPVVKIRPGTAQAPVVSHQHRLLLPRQVQVQLRPL